MLRENAKTPQDAYIGFAVFLFAKPIFLAYTVLN
jgi:hypothetical protein